MSSAKPGTLPPWWKRDIGDLFKRQPAANPVEPLAAPSDDSKPLLPQANLLPATIRDTIAVRRIRSVALLLAVIILAPAAGLWTWWSTELNTLSNQLNEITATNSQLQAKVRALTPVETLIKQVDAQRGLLEDSLAAQPNAVLVLDRLETAAAANGPVDIESVTITYYPIPTPGEATNPCPDPDPFSEEIAIGCLTFSASTVSRSALSSFLADLETDPIFVGPFVNTSSIAAQTEGTEGDKVTFSGSSGISTEALVTPLTTEEIDAILNPPEETATEDEPTEENGDS